MLGFWFPFPFEHAGSFQPLVRHACRWMPVFSALRVVVHRDVGGGIKSTKHMSKMYECGYLMEFVCPSGHNP